MQILRQNIKLHGRYLWFNWSIHWWSGPSHFRLNFVVNNIEIKAQNLLSSIDVSVIYLSAATLWYMNPGVRFFLSYGRRARSYFNVRLRRVLEGEHLKQFKDTKITFDKVIAKNIQIYFSLVYYRSPEIAPQGLRCFMLTLYLYILYVQEVVTRFI